MLPFNSPELTVLIKVSTIALFCYQQNLCCLLALLEFTLFSFQGAGSNLLQGQIETLHSCEMLQSNLNGGDKRNRTADPLLARQVLSQLSYTPVCRHFLKRWWAQVDSNHRPHDYQSCALAS